MGQIRESFYALSTENDRLCDEPIEMNQDGEQFSGENETGETVIFSDQMISFDTWEEAERALNFIRNMPPEIKNPIVH